MSSGAHPARRIVVHLDRRAARIEGVIAREPPPESSRPLWHETQALFDALNRMDVAGLAEMRLED